MTSRPSSLADAPSSAQPAAKKSKAASSSDDKNKGKSADKGADNKGKASAPLVELKGSKFELKQKPLKVNATMSYLRGASSFVALVGESDRSTDREGRTARAQS